VKMIMIENATNFLSAASSFLLDSSTISMSNKAKPLSREPIGNIIRHRDAQRNLIKKIKKNNNQNGNRKLSIKLFLANFSGKGIH